MEIDKNDQIKSKEEKEVIQFFIDNHPFCKINEISDFLFKFRKKKLIQWKLKEICKNYKLQKVLIDELQELIDFQEVEV